jgi:hypothetical protein
MSLGATRDPVDSLLQEAPVLSEPEHVRAISWLNEGALADMPYSYGQLQRTGGNRGRYL